MRTLLTPLAVLVLLLIMTVLSVVHSVARAEPVNPKGRDLESAAAAAQRALRSVSGRAADGSTAIRAADDRSSAVAGALTPNVDALPTPKPGPAPVVDPAALARRFDRIRDNDSASSSNLATGLLIFVSFSMPSASLEQLSTQVTRAGGSLVLRGVDQDSIGKTAQRIKSLAGERKVSVLIDPRLFTLYGIHAVPTVVVAAPGAAPTCKENQCTNVPAFASVAGDVSLDHALRVLIDGDPTIADRASAYLRRLRSSL